MTPRDRARTDDRPPRCRFRCAAPARDRRRLLAGPRYALRSRRLGLSLPLRATARVVRCVPASSGIRGTHLLPAAGRALPLGQLSALRTLVAGLPHRTSRLPLRELPAGHLPVRTPASESPDRVECRDALRRFRGRPAAAAPLVRRGRRSRRRVLRAGRDGALRFEPPDRQRDRVRVCSRLQGERNRGSAHPARLRAVLPRPANFRRALDTSGATFSRTPPGPSMRSFRSSFRCLETSGSEVRPCCWLRSGGRAPWRSEASAGHAHPALRRCSGLAPSWPGGSRRACCFH